MPNRLLELVPADAAAVLLFDGRSNDPAGAGSGSAARLAAALLRHTREMGLIHDLDSTAGLVLDAAFLLPELARHPRALVLLDVSANPRRDGGSRLGGISAGLLVLTGSDHYGIAAGIQSLLSRYGDGVTGRLTQRKVNDAIVCTLTDTRLPPWAVIEWGPVDDCYVMTIGAGAFQRFVSAWGGVSVNLMADEWFEPAHRRCRGSVARWEWTVDFRALHDQLAPALGKKPGEVLESLGLDGTTRGLWTMGPDCLLVDAACTLRVEGGDRHIPLAVTGEAANRFKPLLPPGAQSGIVIQARPREMIPRVCKAYLASRSPHVQSRLAARWASIEAEAGVHAADDILKQLGRHIVVHDFPPHPLGVSLFRTILVELDGPANSVRVALDGLLESTRVVLNDRTGAATPTSWLKRDDDGVWYVQFGLLGPALAVAESWIVISYSPQAVRQNLEYLQNLDASTVPSP